jgi:beta-glucosidase-like glycosyl hydrolase
MTDALNMKGVSNFADSGSVDLAAFLAGHDVLLFSENIPVGISSIAKAFDEGRISEERLAHSVKKILGAKYAVGLHELEPIPTESLYEELNAPVNDSLHRMIAEQSLTVLKNESDLLPMDQNKDYVYLKLGDGRGDSVIDELKKNLNIEAVTPEDSERIARADGVLIGYHRRNYRRTYDMAADDRELITKLARDKHVILHVFASQYVLENLPLGNVDALVISYENSGVFQRAAASFLLGRLEAQGRLSAAFDSKFPTGFGMDVPVNK